VWSGVAAQVTRWARAEGLVLRDAIVLVPFLQLLPLARRAFASLGGWMPRIETTRTLAAAVGPPLGADGGAPTLDAALDQLIARQMLSRETWAGAWQRRDRRGYERALARLVATAHAFVAAAANIAPDDRAGWWASARVAVSAVPGPGGRESSLARIALEWATLAAPLDTDRLFDLRPAAWVVVQAGGADPLVSALTSAAAAPCLVVDTDVRDDAPFDAAADRATVSVAVLDSFEDEAEAAAAQIFEHLRRGERPVALIAQDRVLVRRVRALLERAHADVVDETGWKLSTTRAAAVATSCSRLRFSSSKARFASVPALSS